ncbi:MAG: hypothetical protein RL385_4216 [Pseudomonadota bacterium]|jgi:hypothetical protein
MAYSNSLIDKRVVDRNIAKGLVDPEQLKALIEALPDSESNCVKVSLDGNRGGESADLDEGDAGEDLDDEDLDDEDEDEGEA